MKSVPRNLAVSGDAIIGGAMRRARRNKVIALFLCVMQTALFSACKLGASKNEEKIVLLSPSNGEAVALVHPDVQNFLEGKTDGDVAKSLWKYHVSDTMRYDSQFAFLSWEYAVGKKYTVTIATDDKFDHVVQETDVYTQSVELDCLLPASTYYWKVTCEDDTRSPVGSFQTKDQPTFLEVDGVDNFRDIGGYQTESGKRVEYGKLYRSARLEDATDNGQRTMTELLGIKSEIDLRNHEEMSEGFTFNGNGNYLNVTFNPYHAIIPQSAGAYDKRVEIAFSQIFAFLSKEENYPIVFHCSAGADRTGTLAFLINGVLGVPYFELAKDFELTSFSNQGDRWRDAIVETPFGYAFEGGGRMVSGRMTVTFGLMYQLMMNNYATEDGRLSSAIINYLVNQCGVQPQHITSMKEILLSK